MKYSQSDIREKFSTTDVVNDIYNIISTQIPYYSQVRARTRTHEYTSEAELGASDCLSYIIEIISNVKILERRSVFKLATVISVISFLRCEKEIWDKLLELVTVEKIVSDIFLQSINDFQVSFQAQPSRTPISDKKLFDKYQNAVANCDIKTLCDVVPGLPLAGFDLMVGQYALAAQKTGGDRILKAFDSHKNLITIFKSFELLSNLEYLNISCHSSNQLVKFSGVWLAIKSKQPLSEQEKVVLKDLIVSVAQTGDSEWTSWLSGFNEYPIRYPNLQISLGIALSELPKALIEMYIESMPMDAELNSKTRVIVTDCLRSFLENASAMKKKAFLATAFEKWKQWGFRNSVATQNNLTNIHFSNLDYAITGYFLDSENSIETLSTFKNEFMSDLSGLVTKWYEKKIEISSEAKIVLSKLQPVFHSATLIKEGEQNCLQMESIYQPSETEVSKFQKMRLNLN